MKREATGKSQGCGARWFKETRLRYQIKESMFFAIHLFSGVIIANSNLESLARPKILNPKPPVVFLENPKP